MRTKTLLGVVLVVALASAAGWQLLPWAGANANRLLGKPYTISKSKGHAQKKGVLVATASTETLSEKGSVELTEAWVETNSTAKRKTTYLCFKLNGGALGVGIKLERQDGSREIIPTANRSNTVAMFLTESPTSVEDIAVEYFDGEFDPNNPIIFYRHTNGTSLDENESSTDNEVLKLILRDLKLQGENAG